MFKCLLNINKTRFEYYDQNFICSNDHINNVMQETSKRIIKPIYILIISLISSFLILKSKDEPNSNLYKFILFILGIIFLSISEITSVSINYFSNNKIAFVILPFVLTIFAYIGLLIKLKSKNIKKI